MSAKELHFQPDLTAKQKGDNTKAELDCGLTKDDIPLRRIGATIAVHTGPEAIGVGILRRYDVPQPQTEGLLASLLNKEPKRAPKTI